MADCWALLPLKDLVQAKTRLGGVLASHERRALAQAMAEDVLAALTSSSALAGVLLVSDDPGADMLAAKYGVDWLPESALEASGLNEVVTRGCEVLRERGVEQVMVVHSDLPLLSAGDIDQLVADFAASPQDLLLVPDRHRDGTNILLSRTSTLPVFQYGSGSFSAHQAMADQQSLAVGECSLPEVALDIDQPADLIDAWLRLRSPADEGSPGQHSRAFLSRSEITRRLAALTELYSANARSSS